MARLTVLGAGAFGTAIAAVLARNGHAVTLWCHEPDVAHAITTQHINNFFLPDIALPATIVTTTSIEQALAQAEYIFEAVPVAYLRDVLLTAKPSAQDEQVWVTLSKGVEESTLLLPSQIMHEVLGASTRVAVASGPNFARELAQGGQSAMEVASSDVILASEVASLLRNDVVLVSTSDDMIGVQWCGALKNVLTIALGVARGVGMPQNGIAALCAFGLQEIRLLVESRGGRAATVYGICGVGDLLLTAFGTQSRNMRFGKALGEGCSLAQAYERAGGIVEGANTAQSLFKQFHLDTKSYTKHPLKLLAAVAAVVMEEAAPSAIVQSYWAL